MAYIHVRISSHRIAMHATCIYVCVQSFQLTVDSDWEDWLRSAEARGPGLMTGGLMAPGLPLDRYDSRNLAIA